LRRFAFILTLTLLLLSCGSNSGSSPTEDPAELADLPVFQSVNGVLDILMEARVSTTTQLAGFQPQAWVYQVCQRSAAVNNTCPDDSHTFAPYGGVRLQLQAGDHLKIRLVNRLPPAPDDAEHANDDPGMLAANPTNLHTHGMIVEPRRAGNGDSTYGDYVYVLGYPAGLTPPLYTQHPGLDYTDQPIDYDIYVPPNHPSGIFWFHPHVHGLSLNQVSAGMAGVITVGSINDYLKDASGAPLVNSNVRTRYLLLKDMEIEKDSSMLTQQDSGFCAPDPAPTDAPREGFCPGQPSTDDQGNPVDHTGGRWVHSINGEVFPHMHVNGGEVWRITDASGSRSYDLTLVDDTTGRPLAFQVLSLDGVSLDIPVGTPATQIQAALRNRVSTVPCPSGALGSQPVCGNTMHVMPSSRAEIYVTSNGSQSATLLTPSYQSGETGDDWPAIHLAHVFFTSNPSANARVLSIHGDSRRALVAGGVLGSSPLVKLPGVAADVPINDAIRMAKATPRTQPLRKQVDSLEDPTCQALPAGHTRRIFFGVPSNGEFGLGYEELDENGTPVPGTFQDIAPFDHSSITVCLPLAPGNQPVTEQWQLVNVSGEDHNFHIHQTKFRLVDGSGNTSVLMDSIAVPHGTDACDGTVATWRSGQCQVNTVTVAIPFSQIGDFVYHCHILEHEDGGMMAHIRVVAQP